MTSLLLDDKAGLELKDTDEAALIEIIAATVARSVAVGPPPGRGKAKVGGAAGELGRLSAAAAAGGLRQRQEDH